MSLLINFRVLKSYKTDINNGIDTIKKKNLFPEDAIKATKAITAIPGISIAYQLKAVLLVGILSSGINTFLVSDSSVLMH